LRAHVNVRQTAMFKTLTLGRLVGIRVGVDVSWIGVFAFVTFSIATSLSGLPPAATYAVATACALFLFASVVAHELAHALVARRFGVRTRSITLFLFGGVATLESEPPSPRAEVWIALAGPAMSAALGACAFGLLALFERTLTGVGGDVIATLTAYLALANGMLALFNLIPAFPMDGGRVLRAAIWRARRSRAAATGAASIVSLILAAALVVAGCVTAIGVHLWQCAWYVAIGAFLAIQGWRQLREARLLERLERDGELGPAERAA